MGGNKCTVDDNRAFPFNLYFNLIDGISVEHLTVDEEIKKRESVIVTV